ncbi:MAG: hypothetical protein WCY88_12730 [Spongiibacteraceae bacterium]
MNKQQFIESIQSQLFDIFSAYAQGKDVPPATLFRTEGFIEAGCYMECVTIAEARALVHAVYRQVFDAEMSAMPAGTIHLANFMPRAPVYASTKAST